MGLLSTPSPCLLSSHPPHSQQAQAQAVAFPSRSLARPRVFKTNFLGHTVFQEIASAQRANQ